MPVGVASSYSASSPSAGTSSSPTVDGEFVLALTGTVTSMTGSLHIIHSMSSALSTFDEAEELGAALGRALVANGASVILDEVNKERDAKNLRDQQKKMEDAKIKAEEAAAVALALAAARPTNTSSSSPSSSPPSIPITLQEHEPSSSGSPVPSSSSLAGPSDANNFHPSRPTTDLHHLDSFLNGTTPFPASWNLVVRSMPGAWPDDRKQEEEEALGHFLSKIHVEELDVTKERFEKVAGKEGAGWKAVSNKYVH